MKINFGNHILVKNSLAAQSSLSSCLLIKMAQDLFEHWYIKLAQFIFSRALAQVEGIVRQRVLWPQFLSNLFYMKYCLSASSSSRSKSLELRSTSVGSCCLLLVGKRGGKRNLALGFWSAILFYQRADCFARLLLSAYRWIPAEGQLYAQSALQGHIWPKVVFNLLVET